MLKWYEITHIMQFETTSEKGANVNENSIKINAK
jgi:hypothetical protein